MASLRLVLLAGTLLFLFLAPDDARAQDRRPLVLTGDQDYPPLSYLDNGEPRGFDVDVARAVGKILGRDVQIRLMEWAAAQDAVRRGEADGLTDLAISDERRRLFEFADPTVTHDFGLFVRVGDTTFSSLNGLRGKTVGVTAAGFPREFLGQRPDFRMIVVANYDEGFRLLIAGSLDALAADVWAGASTVQRGGFAGVALGGAPFASLPAAIAVRKGDTALVADINRAIQSLRADGTLQQIQNRWRPQEMVFFSRARVQNLVAWGVGAVLAVLLIAAIVWALTLRRQVRARRTVEDRLTLLAHAFQSASDCIAITDPTRHIVHVNDAFLRTYEYEEREVLGQHIDMVRAKDKSPDVPDGALASGAIDDWRGEVWSRSKTGRVFPVSLVTTVVRDARGDVAAVVGVARDITNEQLAEDALRSSEEKFFKVFRSSPDAIAIADFGPGGILDINESFERITGYSRSEVLGRRMTDLGLFVDPLFRDAAVEKLRLEGTGREVEYQIRRKNGDIATLMASGATIDIGGRPSFVTISRDITERKRFETHLRQAAEVNRLLLSKLDLEGLYVAVIESTHQILSLDYASLVLYDQGSRILRLQAQRGVLDAGRSQTAAEGLAALALEHARLRVLRRTELEALGGAAAELLAAGLESVCCLPLSTPRGTLGVLNVGSTSRDAFSEDDVTLLHQLSTYVAIAIQNARSYEETRTLKDQLSLEKLYLEEEIRVDHNFADIVGDSPAIKRVLQQIETVAPTDASVLLLGETGTGKELLARALHELSPRKDRTFVRLNVAALPATLLESELFGYERGAFTGAAAGKVGRIELAHRGTLFLDEVGDIPLEVQPKFLRALQEREFERIGGTRTQHVDFRLIAATNRDLQRMVDEGTFRSDLFYRLNVFPVQVPPLRDRKEDIPILVRYFAQKFASRLKRQITSIPASTITAFQEWDWPGNIRELENVIERAVIISPGEVLQVPTFQMKPSADAGAPARRTVPIGPADLSSPSALSTFVEGERKLILNALRETDGVIAGPAGAAARLGMKRTTLQSKMRKLGIRRPTF